MVRTASGLCPAECSASSARQDRVEEDNDIVHLTNYHRSVLRWTSGGHRRRWISLGRSAGKCLQGDALMRGEMCRAAVCSWPVAECFKEEGQAAETWDVVIAADGELGRKEALHRQEAALGHAHVRNPVTLWRAPSTKVEHKSYAELQSNIPPCLYYTGMSFLNYLGS